MVKWIKLVFPLLMFSQHNSLQELLFFHAEMTSEIAMFLFRMLRRPESRVGICDLERNFGDVERHLLISMWWWWRWWMTMTMTMTMMNDDDDDDDDDDDEWWMMNGEWCSSAFFGWFPTVHFSFKMGDGFRVLLPPCARMVRLPSLTRTPMRWESDRVDQRLIRNANYQQRNVQKLVLGGSSNG